MKLFAKIFSGVFFGVLAALVVIKIPSRIAERQALLREVKWQSNYLSLSPATLKSRCGPPFQDEVVVTNGDYLYRAMSYQAGPITFEFFNATGDLKKKPDENDHRQWAVTVRGVKGGEGAHEAHMMLPCSVD